MFNVYCRFLKNIRQNNENNSPKNPKICQSITMLMIIASIWWGRVVKFVNDLISSEDETCDLFDKVNIQHDNLLPSLEIIKRKLGKSAIQLASANLSNQWQMQRHSISQHYTTKLNDILIIQ